MPPKLITIEFKPKGDKKLITALNNLAKAQDNLKNKFNAGGGAAKKFSGAAAGLTAKLKVQNITWKQLGISGEVLKKAYQGNLVALERLRIAMAGSNAQTLLGVRNNRLLANSFATLRSKLLLVSFGAMLIERGIVSLVKAYARQEAANEKLRAGLANVAGTVPGVTQRLIDYSAALQQAAVFGDEMITTGMVQFTTFGLNEKAIKALTPQVLNVARAIQTVSGTMPDLNSLFIAFGKATTTGIGTLTRYGVVLTDVERAQLKTMEASERAVKIGEILERQYGGLNEAYKKTTMGMLEAAELARGDAAEAFGEVLAPAVLAASKGLKIMFEAMDPRKIAIVTTAVVSLGVAYGGLTAAVLLYNGAMRKAAIATMGFTKALAKNPIALIAVAISLATVALMEYFGVFDYGNTVLTDAQKREAELLETLDKLPGIQEKGAEALQHRLDLLNATNEVEKILIGLTKDRTFGVLDASDKERELAEAIVAKIEADERLKRETKEHIRLTRELVRIEKRLERERQRAETRALADAISYLNNRIKSLKDASKEASQAQSRLTASLQEQHIVAMKLNKASELEINLAKNNFSWTNKIKDAISELVKLEEKHATATFGARAELGKAINTQKDHIEQLGITAGETERLIRLNYESAKALELENKMKKAAVDLANEINSLQAETTTGKFEAIIAEQEFILANKEALATLKDGTKDYSIINQLLADLAVRFEALSDIELPSLPEGGWAFKMEVAPIDEALDVRLGVLSQDAAQRLALEREITNETTRLNEEGFLSIEEGMAHHAERMKELDALMLENKKLSLEEITQMSLDSFGAMTSAMSTQVNARMKKELTVLKASAKYQNVDADRRKKLEKEVTDKYAAERTRVAQFEKASSLAAAGMNIAEGITRALGKANIPLAILVGVLGAVQLAAIASTPIPKFQTGGLIGGRRHSRGGTTIEAEQGEFIMSRRAVQSVGIENLNRMNEGGDGGDIINVNISAPLVDDTVVDTIIPAIRDAVRRGEDLGIS